MFDKTTFNAIAGAAVFFGGIAWFLWQEIKPPWNESEYNQPRRIEPVKPKQPKPKQQQTKPKELVKPIKPAINPETLRAMHKQADAERGIAEALERKMLHTPDPIKHARLEKQAANSWLRFNRILDQIDKLTMQ